MVSPAAEAEPAEGGRLRLRALKGFVSHVQRALLSLDEVRRIYVAFGEHPAAGGFSMFLGTLGSYPMKKALLWVASWCLFSIVHDLEAPLWRPCRHFRNLEHMVVSFGYFGGPRGSSLATLGPTCATLDVHFYDFLTLWGMP